jgi:hypothetical protein
VGDYKTISKVAALERAGGDFSKVKFHMMDDTWDKVDVTKDPTMSWHDLLKFRAWQLRDKYQHVYLLYSGGWDSHTALMAFVDNGVPLDGIVVYDRSSYVHDLEQEDAYKNAEKIIKDHNLNTKLISYDIPWDYHATIYKQAKEDWIYLPGCQLCFNQTSRIVKHEALASLLKIKDQHKFGTAVFVEAVDKPRVNLRDGKWYQFFVDASIYPYVGKGGSELFYFTPDLPELQLKQAHMSIRYFENKINSTPGAGEELVHKVQGNSVTGLFPEWNRAMGRTCSTNQSAIHGLAKSLRERKMPGQPEVQHLLSFNQNYVDAVYDIYKAGLEKTKSITGIDLMKNDLPAIISKQYYMRDFIGKV